MATSSKPNILFLVRAYNDIDHISPVIHRLAKDQSARCQVFCCNPTYDLAGDFRLNFLVREHRVPVGYLYQSHLPSLAHRLTAAYVCGSQAGRGRGLRGRNAVNWVHEHLARYRLFGLDWARDMLAAIKPSLLVVDWQRPKFFNIPAVLQAAQEAGIPILALPHGMNLVTNTLCTNKAQESGQDQDFGRDWRMFDHNLVQFELYRQRVIAGGVPAGKVTVMGSARFCPEWRKVLRRILPSDQSLAGRGEGKLKLVYMDQHHRMRLHQEQVAKAVLAMAKRDGLELLVKPATRGVGQALADQLWGISSQEIRSLDCLAPEIHSLNLIRWAQAVLCASSSICLDVLLEGKTFIYPKHTHDNRMMFEDYGACWQVNSQEELEAALDQAAAEPDKRPYSQQQVDAFLAEAVFGGEPGRDVLGDYAEFILQSAVGGPPQP